MSTESGNAPAAPAPPAAEVGSPTWWIAEMSKAGAPSDVIGEYARSHGVNLPSAKPAQQTAPSTAQPDETNVHRVTAVPQPPSSGPSPEAWLRQMKTAAASEADIANAAAELGVSKEQLAKFNAPTEGLDAYLESIGAAPPASPEEYRLPAVEGTGDPAAIIEGTKQVQSWLHEAKLPQAIGESIARDAAQWEKSWSGMSEPQRQLEEAKTRTMLARLWGENYSANLALVQEFVRSVDAKSPGLVEYLETSGVGNDPRVIAKLFAQAANQAAYPGK